MRDSKKSYKGQQVVETHDPPHSEISWHIEEESFSVCLFELDVFFLWKHPVLSIGTWCQVWNHHFFWMLLPQKWTLYANFIWWLTKVFIIGIKHDFWQTFSTFCYSLRILKVQAVYFGNLSHITSNRLYCFLFGFHDTKQENLWICPYQLFFLMVIRIHELTNLRQFVL